jgi:hypothetical protein
VCGAEELHSSSQIGAACFSSSPDRHSQSSSLTLSSPYPSVEQGQNRLWDLLKSCMHGATIASVHRLCPRGQEKSREVSLCLLMNRLSHSSHDLSRPYPIGIDTIHRTPSDRCLPSSLAFSFRLRGAKLAYPNHSICRRLRVPRTQRGRKFTRSRRDHDRSASLPTRGRYFVAMTRR